MNDPSQANSSQLTPRWRLSFLGWCLLLSILANIGIWAGAAQADEMSIRQSEIFRTAFRADGWLTEDMHREFWTAAPAADRSNSEVRKFLERAGGQALIFQRESWESIKSSLQAGRVIKSPGYETAKSTVLSSSTAALAREQVATGIKNAEGLIDAAATGKPFVTARGTFYVTDELVSQTIAGLEASFCRFQQLADPTWNRKVEERKYVDVHVRILSDCPFRREFHDIAVDGKKVRVSELAYAISDKDQLGVTFAAVEGQFSSPEQSVARIAQAALRGMGIIEAKPMTSRWRGRVSSEAVGTMASSQGTIYASVRVIEAREHLGAWTFMSLSLQSLVDANARRESLEASTQLDDR
jgi:hypothetical protein